MICNNCKRIVCLHAFSYSNCEKCTNPITTPHMPSYKLCEKCSDESNRCIQCGKDIKKD